MIRRKIKDGKLCLVPKLIGGPQDGLLVDSDIAENERIKFLVRKDVVYSCGPIDKTAMFPPSEEIDEYERISAESFIYRGTRKR